MLSHNKLKVAIIAALLIPAMTYAADAGVSTASPVSAMAAPSPQAAVNLSAKPQISAKTNAAANEIADINERLAVLSAKLAELELQSKIASKTAEIKKTNNPIEDLSGSESYVPTIMDISGIDGKLKASLYVQGGNTQTVTVGDKAGSWTVTKIQMDFVTVQKGKEVVKLSFGSYSNNPNSTNSPNVPPINGLGNGMLQPQHY